MDYVTMLNFIKIHKYADKQKIGEIEIYQLLRK